MLTSLKRIREQQSLSIEFVTSILNIDTEAYYSIGNGTKEMPKEVRDDVIKLFGIEESDLYPKKIELEDCSNIGLARTYSNITEKDKIAISKLLNLRKHYNHN